MQILLCSLNRTEWRDRLKQSSAKTRSNYHSFQFESEYWINSMKPTHYRIPDFKNVLVIN